MASPIKTVALCSPTGKAGPHLLKALQNEGLSVTVISRASSTATFPPNLSVIKVSDEYREDELVAAFRGKDAVVLSLSFELLPQSKKFAQASITAGNRWLIASTYGANLEDPNHAIFPASVPHRQAVNELLELQMGHDNWAWTSISCGPWPELSAAAQAWHIDPSKKTAELVDEGRNVFTSTTREQLSLAVARVLKRQPPSTKNKQIYIASFEANMLTWMDAYKQIVGADGWIVTNVSSETLIKRSQAHLAAGQFPEGYTGLALAVCTGQGYQNQFSKFTTLANEELGLPKEDMFEVLKHGISLPNPFA